MTCFSLTFSCSAEEYQAQAMQWYSSPAVVPQDTDDPSTWRGTILSQVFSHILLSLSGHPVNLTSVMLVMKKLKDLRRVSKAMQIPRDRLTEILEGSEEDSVGQLSEVWLETKKPWKALKEILVKCDELPSAELAYLMEMHISKGKALAIGWFCCDVLTIFNRCTTETTVRF